MVKTIVRVSCVLLLFSGVSLAQDNPLEYFGSEVGAVLRFREPDRTIERISAFVDAVQPGTGQLVQGNAAGLGQLISNPTMTGVDQTKDWYVGVYARGEQEPQVVFAIPAVDMEQMKAAVGDDFQQVTKGKYLLYADGSDEIKVPGAASESIKGSLQGQAGEVFDRGQLSLFLNLKQLTSVYRAQLDQGYDQGLQQLNNLQFQIPQQPGMNLGPIFDMYGKAFESLFQGLNDSNSLTLTLNVKEDSLSIEDYLAFRPDSGSGKAWGTDSSSTLDLIQKVPDGGVVYYAGAGEGMAAMIRWGANLSASINSNEEQKAQIESVTKQLDSLKWGQMSGMVGIGTADSGMIRMVQINQVTPMDKVRDFTRGMVEAMSVFEANGFKQTTKIQKEAETYGAYKGDIVTLTQEFDDNLPGVEQQEQMQKLMFGPDGMVSRYLYLKDSYLVTAGGGQEAMKKALARAEASGGNGLADYRQDLISPANLHLLMDVPGAVGLGFKAAADIPGNPLPIDAAMIDNLNLERSYIGFSLASKSSGIHCKTDIPVKQIQGFVKLGGLFGALQAGGGF